MPGERLLWNYRSNQLFEPESKHFHSCQRILVLFLSKKFATLVFCFGFSGCACSGSKDGTAEVGKAGFKIGGEPCVWCGDGPGPRGGIASFLKSGPLSSSAKGLHD